MSIEQTSANLGQAGEILLDIAGFWAREWKAWLRFITAKFLPEHSELTRIGFDSGAITIWKPRAAKLCIPINGDSAGRSAIAALRHEIGGPSAVELVLPEDEVLRPTVRLPKASRNVLRKALSFELARVSPVDPAQLYFDFTLAAALSEGSEVQVAVRAVRRSTLEGAIAKCRAAGLSVAGIRFAADISPAKWAVFPIDRTALLLSHWRRLKLVALGGLTLLLIVALILTIYARGSRALSELDNAVAKARVPAASAEQLRLKFQEVAGVQSFLEHQKQKPLLVASIANLSRALPDDTWLTGLQITGKKVRIEGYSRSASHLVTEIAGAGFTKPQFESPLTHDNVDKAERFDLSFEAPR